MQWPRRGGETRGIPTAWSASPLAGELAPTSELPPVWPDPMGDVKGIALQPLHHSAPEIARRDPALAERLALVDALRLGDARVRGLAAKLLRRRLPDRAVTRAPGRRIGSLGGGGLDGGYHRGLLVGLPEIGECLSGMR